MFHKGKIQGLIDFDQVCVEITIFELGYFLVTLFYQIWQHYEFRGDLSEQFSELSHTFLSSYNTINPLSELELQSIPWMIILALISFVIHFEDLNLKQEIKYHIRLIERIYSRFQVQDDNQVD